MRQIPGHSLWLGHAGDGRNLAALLTQGVQAIVDLAANEPPLSVTRDLIYCRIPLVDGAGNPPVVLRLAVDTVTALLKGDVPTLVCCSGGMSRSPAVAAAAIAECRSCPPEEALVLVTQVSPADVAPGLWQDVLSCLDRGTDGS